MAQSFQENAKTTPVRSIRIAVLAMGGEGGGVLANWLIDLARNNGYVGQMTSVPGVAQRTGATIYYIEMFPVSEIPAGQNPVLALMPVPGDVDIVLASELMEAGRAIQRGIVTPDRTALIASSHRIFSMTERVSMADGRVDENALLAACRSAAQRFISFDMMRMAEQSGSVISAVMFGALAGADLLPFDRQAFETTIKDSGVGVKASLQAFGTGYSAAKGGLITPQVDTAAESTQPAPRDRLADLRVWSRSQFPAAALEIIEAGLEQCADWQDKAYAQLYLERLKPFAEFDQTQGGDACRLLQEVARQLALGMTYEDTIRVADLKIRETRFDRVAKEVGIKPGQILQIREYLHPRRQEILETLPAFLSRLIAGSDRLVSLIDHVTQEGRTVETTSIRGFLMLYCVAGLRRWRRSTPRFAVEQNNLTDWLQKIIHWAPRHYDLAVELAELRGLVKGYGDTHARGSENYNRICAIIPYLHGADGSATLQSLRKAANADESGAALQTMLENLKIQSPQPHISPAE
jgi:indolepyruvate ferredoxin oxidoreductase, beta subunit